MLHENVKKLQHVWYNILTFYNQVAKLFDRPSYVKIMQKNWTTDHSNSEKSDAILLHITSPNADGFHILSSKFQSL